MISSLESGIAINDVTMTDMQSTQTLCLLHYLSIKYMMFDPSNSMATSVNASSFMLGVYLPRPNRVCEILVVGPHHFDEKWILLQTDKTFHILKHGLYKAVIIGEVVELGPSDLSHEFLVLGCIMSLGQLVMPLRIK
jgi:hypothetical protein